MRAGVRLIAFEEVRNYRKIVCIKNIFENGWWEDAYFSSYSPGSAPDHKLRKPSKELGIFQMVLLNPAKDDKGPQINVLNTTKYDNNSYALRCPYTGFDATFRT